VSVRWASQWEKANGLTDELRRGSIARTVPVLVFAILLAQFGSAPRAVAAGGDLDTTFSADGRVIGPVRLNGNAAAFQEDGKIIVAGAVSGRFGVARYDADGSLDATFDGDGTVATPFRTSAGCSDVANAVVVQTDGKIVAVGYSYCTRSKFALARYDSDGTLDASFGGDGKVLTSFGDPRHCSAYAEAAAIQTDGRVLAAGEAHCGVSARARFAVARYASDGTLDVTFGGDGEVRTDFTAGYDFANDVAVQADGKIVVAGPAPYANEHARFGLARYHVNGTLDTGFGGDGKVRTGFKSSRCGDSADPQGMALQADGKVVVAGYAGCAATAGGLFHPRWVLARYTTIGGLDTTFGGDGRVVSIFGADTCGDVPYGGVAIQTDGKIVAAGTTGCARLRFTLARYGPHGRLDSTFGGDGKVTTAFGSAADCIEIAFDVAIQIDGRIVAAGTGACQFRFVMARYLAA
jgi:serralysin